MPETPTRQAYPWKLAVRPGTLSGMFAFDMPVRIPADLAKPEISSRSIHVDLAVWKRLAEIAAKIGRSRNALVAGILRDWVRDWDADEAEKGKPTRKQ
jgi:hypothetical protein